MLKGLVAAQIIRMSSRFQPIDGEATHVFGRERHWRRTRRSRLRGVGTSRARDEAGRSPTDADRLARVEAWFVRRGVPQLDEGYGTESRVDARVRGDGIRRVS